MNRRSAVFEPVSYQNMGLRDLMVWSRSVECAVCPPGTYCKAVQGEFRSRGFYIEFFCYLHGGSESRYIDWDDRFNPGPSFEELSKSLSQG